MSADEDTIEPEGVETQTAVSAAEPSTAGARLKAAREEKRLTLDLIAAETRIPKRHLETIEADDFDALPARTYAIGFARSYARAVECDEKEIADLVREQISHSGPRSSAMGQDMEPGDPAKLPSKGLVIFGGVAALIFALGVITFAGTYYGAGDGPASLLSAIEAEEVAPPVEQAAETSEAAASESPPNLEGQVVFTALASSGWVRFYENEGDVLFEGFLEEGETYVVPEDAQDPWINTGRANQYAITIGGQSVPLLSDEMVQLQAPISAEALLARGNS